MAVRRLSDVLRKGLMAGGGAALLLLVLLATGNVVLRIVREPLGGVYEVISWLGALVTSCALAHTQKEKDNIVVDILSDRFPPSVKRVLDGVAYGACALLFGVVAWRLAAWAGQLRQSGEISETLKVPYHPVVYAVSLGFAALALTLLLDLFGTIYGEDRRT